MPTFHGILAFGYDLGGPELGWKLHGLDEYDEPSGAPWWDQAEHSQDYQTTMMDHLIAELAGFREAYRDGIADYFERQRAAEESLGVTIETHGHPDRPGYLLVTNFMRTPGYDTAFVTAEFRDVSGSDDRALTRALDTLGIRPTQESARWILAAEV